MLRPTIVAALLAVAPCLGGCGLNTFETSVKGQTTVEGDPNGLLGALSAFPGVSGFSRIDFSQDQEFKNQGVKKENVTSVRVTRLYLTILSPTNGDFAFLDSLELIAKSEGLPDLPIAEKKDIASLPKSLTLDLDVKAAELQPYVTAPAMTLGTSGKGGYPKTDTVIEATVDLKVEWKLL